MNEILYLIDRDKELFAKDLETYENELLNKIDQRSFLIIGGAGSIGQAVVKEIFKRNPKVLHVIDISENNLAELVRDIRSSFGYISGDFSTFPLDCGSVEFKAFISSQKHYDYILNLSALKHVRSEKDPFTLMRMIKVNILNTQDTIQYAIDNKIKKYFCVSTDKAVGSVNMMGASKKIMEMVLMRAGSQISVSTARFANVAFSDGSLLHGFNQRIQKNQPISAPRDIKRYFMTFEESGLLCLMSCLLGENRDIFLPRVDKLKSITFSEIAVRYLERLGYKPYLCNSEDEARSLCKELPAKKMWPCYFFDSDTTGEKDFEEFYSETDIIDWGKFEDIGIIKNTAGADSNKLNDFLKAIALLRKSGKWSKTEIVDLFCSIVPDFKHKETNKYLDQKM